MQGIQRTSAGSSHQNLWLNEPRWVILTLVVKHVCSFFGSWKAAHPRASDNLMCSSMVIRYAWYCERVQSQLQKTTAVHVKSKMIPRDTWKEVCSWLSQYLNNSRSAYAESSRIDSLTPAKRDRNKKWRLLWNASMCALVPLTKDCHLNGSCHEIVACVSNIPQILATKWLRWKLALVNCRGPPVTVSAMRR